MDDRPILLVEDDDAIRQAMAMLLMGEGYPVQTATDGAEALQAIERTPPSLVVLDMNMPVLDGWGFAAQAKAHGFKLSILVVTGHGRKRCASCNGHRRRWFAWQAVSAHRVLGSRRDSARRVRARA